MCVLGAVAVTGLNNGLGRTPPMGYSSWNDCASEASDCPCKYKKSLFYYFLKNIHHKKSTCYSTLFVYLFQPNQRTLRTQSAPSPVPRGNHAGVVCASLSGVLQYTLHILMHPSFFIIFFFYSRRRCRQVTEARIKNVTRHMIASGLAAKGYVHINVDEGWLKGRDNTTGIIFEDRVKFPSGKKK